MSDEELSRLDAELAAGRLSLDEYWNRRRLVAPTGQGEPTDIPADWSAEAATTRLPARGAPLSGAPSPGGPPPGTPAPDEPPPWTPSPDASSYGAYLPANPWAPITQDPPFAPDTEPAPEPAGQGPSWLTDPPRQPTPWLPPSTEQGPSGLTDLPRQPTPWLPPSPEQGPSGLPRQPTPWLPPSPEQGPSGLPRQPTPWQPASPDQDRARSSQWMTPPPARKGRGPLLAAALALVVVLGLAAWFFITRDTKPGKDAAPPQSPPVTSSSTSSSTGSPTGSPTRTSVGTAPFGNVPKTMLIAAKTGPGSVQDAQTRGLAYAIEKTELTKCGASKGATELRVAPEWSLSGTVFGCRDAAAADRVLKALTNWDRSIGLTKQAVSVSGVDVSFTDKSPPTKSHPFQFHARYTSGTKVIGMVIQATSKQAGLQAVELMLAAAGKLYPPDA